MFKTLEISEDILTSARLSVAEAKVELAVHLYREGRLSIGKARELAEMPLVQFRQVLGARKISSHFDEEELQMDIDTLKDLGRL